MNDDIDGDDNCETAKGYTQEKRKREDYKNENEN